MERILSSIWLQLNLNRKWALNIGLVLLSLVLWGTFRALPRTTGNEIRNIDEAYGAWKAKPEDEPLYRNLKKALIHAPARQKALQGEMAGLFLSVNKIDEAVILAKEPMRRLSLVLPLYAEFADISFMMAEEKMQKALERSISLKEKIKNKNSILYSKNLIRIAFLQGEIANPAGESAAWQEFETFSEDHKDLAALALQGLDNEKVTFQSYLDHRRQSL
jgi:hypothetical protein